MQRGMLARLAARLRARRVDGQDAEGELGEGEVLLDDDCRVSAAESHWRALLICVCR